MSQHTLKATLEGRPVEILMGWDRPLQGFFMIISREDATDDEDEFVYSNLGDEALIDCGGLPPTMDHFVATLSVSFGISAPEAMLVEIERDSSANVGNRYVVHDVTGCLVNPS